jgi:hypothetical protein
LPSVSVKVRFLSRDYRLGSQSVIGRRQTKKIVLELFERRLAIYEGIRDIIGEVARSGTASDDVFQRFFVAVDRAPYFFGEEVQSYLETIRIDMIDLGLAHTSMKNMLDPKRPEWIQRRHNKFLSVTQFYKIAPALFEPYLRAHQKVVTPDRGA